MDAGNGTGKAVATINVTPMIDVLLEPASYLSVPAR